MSYSAEHSADNRTITSAGSHILGRPGPGEPSGFLVVPGRAERERGLPFALGRPGAPLHCV